MPEARTGTVLDLGTGGPIARIVVPVSLQHTYDRGISAAAALAEWFGLPVRLLCAGLDADDSVDRDRGRAMQETRAAFVAAHPSTSVEGLVLASGSPPAEALAGALAPGDLVVLATEAGGGPVDSFAQQLAAASNTPILMIGPQATIGRLVGDVFVAVDGSVLAERCLPAARGFAAALGSNVKLVEAIPSKVSEHVRRLRERGERVSENAYIRDLAERLGDPCVTWEIIHHDDPAGALSEAARHAGAAMIAMSTHGRDGFVGQVFGSVALETVRRAPCPVLVQRPLSQPPAELLG